MKNILVVPCLCSAIVRDGNWEQAKSTVTDPRWLFHLPVGLTDHDNQFVPNNKAFSIPNDLRMQPCEILRKVENCVSLQGSRPDTNRYMALSISIASATDLVAGILQASTINLRGLIQAISVSYTASQAQKEGWTIVF